MRMKIMSRKTNLLIENAWAYAALLAAAYALKYHYSHSTTLDLRWILSPTAKLAGWLSGLSFIFDPDAGYINLEKNICIAPVCAGVNFLIILWCLSGITGVHHFRTWYTKSFWMALCGITSYMTTLWVNACRIVTSIWLYESCLYRAWISPETLHLLLGIILYLAFVYAFYYLIQYVLVRRDMRTNNPPALNRSRHLGRFSDVIPLMMYVSVTILAPLVNNADQIYGGRFRDHSLWVIGAGFAIYGLIKAVRLGYVKLKNILNSV